MIILYRRSPHKIMILYNSLDLHAVGSSLAPEKQAQTSHTHQTVIDGSFHTNIMDKHETIKESLILTTNFMLSNSFFLLSVELSLFEYRSFLLLKKCRTDDPPSPPNKVFASSQVSPTSSSTATALNGPIGKNKAYQSRGKKHAVPTGM